jgi:hypothetical protein
MHGRISRRSSDVLPPAVPARLFARLSSSSDLVPSSLSAAASALLCPGSGVGDTTDERSANAIPRAAAIAEEGREATDVDGTARSIQCVRVVAWSRGELALAREDKAEKISNDRKPARRAEPRRKTSTREAASGTPQPLAHACAAGPFVYLARRGWSSSRLPFWCALSSLSRSLSRSLSLHSAARSLVTRQSPNSDATPTERRKRGRTGWTVTTEASRHLLFNKCICSLLARWEGVDRCI